MVSYFKSYSRVHDKFADSCQPLDILNTISFSSIRLCKGIRMMLILSDLRVSIPQSVRNQLSHVFREFKSNVVGRVNTPHLFVEAFDDMMAWINNNPGQVELICRDLQHVQVLYMIGVIAIRVGVELFPAEDKRRLLNIIHTWIKNIDHLHSLWTSEFPVILYDAVALICAHCTSTPDPRIAIHRAGIVSTAFIVFTTLII